MDLLQRQAAPKCFGNFVPLVSRRNGSMPTRERGRPARTNPPAASAISSTGINRQRRPASASAGPMRFSAGRAVGCNIAGKLSGNRRDSMRAGRPRSRGCRPDGEVGGIRRATSLKAGLSPLGNSRLPASRAPAPHDGADHSRVKQVLFQTSPAPAPTTGRIIRE